MTKKAPAETRKALVGAALRIINERGALALSLDAVAADAGISKGGLLHHFPTKLALLEGVIIQLTDDFAEAVTAELDREEPGRPGRWLRAYIRATFDAGSSVPQVLAQIAAIYPETRTFSDSVYAQSDVLRPRDDGLPAPRTLLIRAACDGWWMGEFFGAPLVSASEQSDLRDELLRLTR